MTTRLSGFVMSIAVVLATLGLGLPACARQGEQATTAPVKIPYTAVATTGMVADLVRGVAGERAKVEVLMGAGVDPHMYRPTRSDIAKLDAATIVFYSGLLLEGKMTETFEKLSEGGKPVYAVTEHLGETELMHEKPEPGAKEKGDGAALHFDPHVWMDPILWREAVEVVEKKLIKLDPAGAAVYTKNAGVLREQFEKLDAYAKTSFASVPEKSRILITAHDAFGYLGKRYQIRVEGIQGISTESEAGVKDIQRLVDLIVNNGVKAVFVETSVSDRNIKALVAGAKAKGHEVSIGGSLFSDAMGEAGTYEGTYVGMLDHNITTITRMLGGTAPEKGMQDKLGRGSAEGGEKKGRE